MKALVNLLLIGILFLMSVGASAAGKCVADSNNSASDAIPMGFMDVQTGWVCPDDNFDYFEIEVPPGAVVSGDISFSSPQASTVLRLYEVSTGTRIINDLATTSAKLNFKHTINEGDLNAGKYIARVFFWSAADYDHQYTLTTSLVIKGSPNCVPDGNETPEGAEEIQFETIAKGYLCQYDHLDIWHFKVNGVQQGLGTITLDSSPGNLFLYVYDYTQTELFMKKTSAGSVSFTLGGPASPVDNGDYYIGVFLPPGRTDENSYSLSLKKLNIREEKMAEPSFGNLEMVDTGEIGLTPVWGEIESVGVAKLPQFARICLDSLKCISESDWDAASNSDETYLEAYGFSKFDKADAKYCPGVVHQDVDDGEVLRLEDQHVVFDGTVPIDGIIGFTATVMEEDSGRGTGNFESALEDLFTTPEGWAVEIGTLGIAGLLTSIGHGLESLFEGGGDDYVATSVVGITYDDLFNWPKDKPKNFLMDLNGGSEGHFQLRWHVEFDPNASRTRGIRFTDWDGFAVGNFQGGATDEILTVVDEDAPGSFGAFRIINGDGTILSQFSAFYTPYDQVAVGDITGDGFDDIVVSSDDNGGFITVYNVNGAQFSMFPAPVTRYDGLVVADVTGDSKCEILLASDDSNSVIVYGPNGTVHWELKLNGWQFSGVRNHSADSRPDAFMVGDVMGDSKPELIFIDGNNGPSSEIRIYDASKPNGAELRSPVRFDFYGANFTQHDAACLADMTGDGKLDLLIAHDDFPKIFIIDLANSVLHSERYWPIFWGGDAIGVGDVLNQGNNQIVIASDHYDEMYIGM